jgi:hypothetical protein
VETDLLLQPVEVEMLLLLPLDSLLFEHLLWLDKKKDSDGGVQFPVCSPISKEAAVMYSCFFGWLETELLQPVFVVELLLLLSLDLQLLDLSVWFVSKKDSERGVLCPGCSPSLCRTIGWLETVLLILLCVVELLLLLPLLLSSRLVVKTDSKGLINLAMSSFFSEVSPFPSSSSEGLVSCD